MKLSWVIMCGVILFLYGCGLALDKVDDKSVDDRMIELSLRFQNATDRKKYGLELIKRDAVWVELRDSQNASKTRFPWAFFDCPLSQVVVSFDKIRLKNCVGWDAWIADVKKCRQYVSGDKTHHILPKQDKSPELNYCVTDFVVPTKSIYLGTGSFCPDRSNIFCSTSSYIVNVGDEKAFAEFHFLQRETATDVFVSLD